MPLLACSKGHSCSCQEGLLLEKATLRPFSQKGTQFLNQKMDTNSSNVPSRRMRDHVEPHPRAPLKRCCYSVWGRLRGPVMGWVLGRNEMQHAITNFGCVLFCSFLRSGRAPGFLQLLYVGNPFGSHFTDELTHFLDQIKLILIQFLLKIADSGQGSTVCCSA